MKWLEFDPKRRSMLKAGGATVISLVIAEALRSDAPERKNRPYTPLFNPEFFEKNPDFANTLPERLGSSTFWRLTAFLPVGDTDSNKLVTVGDKQPFTLADVLTKSPEGLSSELLKEQLLTVEWEQNNPNPTFDEQQHGNQIANVAGKLLYKEYAKPLRQIKTARNLILDLTKGGKETLVARFVSGKVLAFAHTPEGKLAWCEVPVKNRNSYSACRVARDGVFIIEQDVSPTKTTSALATIEQGKMQIMPYSEGVMAMHVPPAERVIPFDRYGEHIIAQAAPKKETMQPVVFLTSDDNIVRATKRWNGQTRLEKWQNGTFGSPIEVDLSHAIQDDINGQAFFLVGDNKMTYLNQGVPSIEQTPLVSAEKNVNTTLFACTIDLTTNERVQVEIPLQASTYLGIQNHEWSLHASTDPLSFVHQCGLTNGSVFDETRRDALRGITNMRGYILASNVKEYETSLPWVIFSTVGGKEVLDIFNLVPPQRKGPQQRPPAYRNEDAA